MDRPTLKSRINSGEDTTSIPGAKRPVSRAATTAARPSTLMRPTSTSAAKSSNSLSKPPARPTLASSARKPTSTTSITGSTISSLQNAKASIASADSRDSGDESKRDGIDARPKRAPLVSSTFDTARPSSRAASTTTTSRSVTTTPAQRTGTASALSTGSRSPTKTRSELGSPTFTLKTSSTPPERPGSRTALRTRPLSSSFQTTRKRLDNKRLSMIPGSPAVRLSGKKPEAEEEDNEEDKNLTSDDDGNHTASTVRSAKAVRPPLGTRKSTQSQIIEQRMHEFEIVSRMLQAAMSTDGTDAEKQDELEQEAAETMARLRSDLVKARTFEKQHGRLPDESELIETQSVTSDTLQRVPTGSDVTSPSGTSGDVYFELAKSRRQVDGLRRQLEDLTSKLETFSRSAQQEGDKANDAAEAAFKEHRNQMREQSNAHQVRIDHMADMHRLDMEDLATQHQAELEALASTKTSGFAQKDAEIDKLTAEVELLKGTAAALTEKEAEADTLKTEIADLKLNALKLEEQDVELQNLRTDVETLQASIVTLGEKDVEIGRLREENEALKICARPEVSTSPSREVSPAKMESSVTDLQKEMDALKKRHQAAKENAKHKSAKALEEHETKLAEMEASHEAKLVDLQGKVTNLETEVEEKQNELRNIQTTHAVELNNLGKEIASQTEKMQKLKQEVENSQQSKLDAAQQAQKVAQLQQDLLELQRSKTREAEMAALALSATQAECTKNIAAAEAQLKEALERLQTEIANHEVNAASVKEEVEERLNKTWKRLVDEASASHEKELAEIQARLVSSQDGIAALEAEHLGQLEMFKKELEELVSTRESSEKEHVNKLAEVQTDFLAKQQELEDAKASHTKQLEETETKYSQAHSEQLNMLRQEHAAQIKSLEEQSKLVLADLEGLESAHVAQLESVKNEAVDANKRVIEEQKVVKDLETQLESVRKQLEEASSSHIKEIESIHSQHVEDKYKTVENLRQEHSRQIAELESQPRGPTEEELGALKAMHKDELEAAEAKARSAIDEIESARFQIRTLKSILQETENESRAKEDEHEEALKKVEQDFSNAIIRISNHSQQLASLSADHEEALRKLRTEMSDTNEKALQSTETEHSNTLDQLKSTMLKETEALEKKLGEEHSRAVAELKKRLDAKESELQKLQASQAEVVRQAKEMVEVGNTKAIRRLKEDYDSQLDAMKETMEIQHQSAIDSMRKGREAESQAHSRRLSESLESVRKEHQRMISQLRTELEEAQKSAQDFSAFEEVNARLEESKRALEKLQLENVRVVSGIKSEHTTRVSELESEIASLKETAESALRDHDVAVDELKTELAERQAELADQSQKHDTAVAQVHEDHETKTSQLQAETTRLIEKQDAALSEARGDYERKTTQLQAEITLLTSQHEAALTKVRQEHKSEMAEIQAELVVIQQLEDTVAETSSTIGALNQEMELLKESNTKLSEKYTTIAAEAEQHRELAQTLRAELEEIRKVAETRASTPASSALVEGKSSAAALGPNTATITDSANKSSPRSRVGLSPSKRAAVTAGMEAEDQVDVGKHNDEEGERVQPISSASNAQQASSFGIGNVGTRSASRDGNQDGDLEGLLLSAKRNVVGQLAGINEQINQLNDLSDEWFHDNQRLARILSLVDDEMGKFRPSVSGPLSARANTLRSPTPKSQVSNSEGSIKAKSLTGEATHDKPTNGNVEVDTTAAIAAPSTPKMQVHQI